VLATVSDAGGQTYPALVVQRFGLGRTAALTVGDLWRWALQLDDQQRDLGKAWRQTVRWLVSDVPEQIELQAEPKRDDPNQAVWLQVRVRDNKFQPVDDAAVSVTVHPVQNGNAPGETTEAREGSSAARGVRLTAEPALTEPGLYQALYVPRDTGGFYAEATVTNSVGAEMGRAETGWANELAAEEFRSLKPNRALLEAIARKTGGELVDAFKLDDFVRGLPHRQMPITETWTFPLWHRAWVFLFALACLVAEWGLRRWKGLA
jgi:hypothetical protein